MDTHTVVLIFWGLLLVGLGLFCVAQILDKPSFGAWAMAVGMVFGILAIYTQIIFGEDTHDQSSRNSSVEKTIIIRIQTEPCALSAGNDGKTSNMQIQTIPINPTQKNHR